MQLGLGIFDSLYQTVITITTVGFEEVGSTQEITQKYRVFTLVLVVLGTGTVLYTFGVLVDSLIEGSLNDELRRRRMLRDIETYEDHVIIAGWGRMGHAIAHSVGRAGRKIVVIDRAPDDDISDHAVVTGEATDDDVLRQAGIDHSVLALWLGHQSIDTTQIYLQADLASREIAQNREGKMIDTSFI